ncbi:MAG: protein kinase [Planctomycetota bacterium]
MGWIVINEPLARAERWVEIPRGGALVCGRSRSADLVLTDERVSRRHVTFVHRDGDDWVADAGARNGVFVNGQRLGAPHRLSPGDRISVGPFDLVYEPRAAASSAKLPESTILEAPTWVTDAGPPAESSAVSVGAIANSDGPVLAPGPAATALEGSRGVPAEGRLEPTARWREVRLIARGGMGEVYHSVDRDLGMAVAIKRLRRRRDDHVQLLQRLQAREAALGRAIRHPNVVQTLEDGVHRGDPYLLLEWVDGVPLDKVLDSEPPSRFGGLEILRQIALGLQAAHQVEVVHADLKPANILIPRLAEPAEVESVRGLLVAPDDHDQDLAVASRTAEIDEELAREIQLRALAALDFERPPFVGREAELELLAIAARQAVAEGLRWVLIFGEPGVGKRRLAAECCLRNEGPCEVRVADGWAPPPPNATGVWISLLPTFLPDDDELRTAYERARSRAQVFELHLQPFLRGQSIRMVERIVSHADSARAFVDVVFQETGGNPARLCAALRRSFEADAWAPSGGGYRFRASAFRPDERERLKDLRTRLEQEEKGLRDLLIAAAPLGNCLDFDTLREATESESAAQYYILDHAVRTGYLRRDPHGFYSFTQEPFRRMLEMRLDPRRRKRIVRRGLPRLARWLERREAPPGLHRELASLELEVDHADRAFSLLLRGALRARSAYDRARFIGQIDEARDCYRRAVARSGRHKEFDAAMTELLGEQARGLAALDRLRQLPCDVRVKITDFGIARKSDEIDRDNVDLPWGTPRYMSPEQARREPLSTASDIYSLGIIAREILEGRHPLGALRGRAALETIARIGVPPPPEDSVEPPALHELVASLLAPEPGERPAAHEVAERLQQIQLQSIVRESHR